MRWVEIFIQNSMGNEHEHLSITGSIIFKKPFQPQMHGVSLYSPWS